MVLTEIVVLNELAQKPASTVKSNVNNPVPVSDGSKTVKGSPPIDHIPEMLLIGVGNIIGAPFVQVGPSIGGVNVIKGTTIILVVNGLAQGLFGVKINGYEPGVTFGSNKLIKTCGFPDQTPISP